MTKVLIIGYYGAENIGDEALLRSTIGIIREKIKNVEIKAITYNQHYTKEIHGIKGISRNKILDILKEINKVDLVVGGGGSLLQNKTSNRSLIYYLILFWYSKLKKKKTILLGNGIGPIKHSFFRGLTVKVLKNMDFITLRDKESYDFLKDNNLKNISISSDLAYNIARLNDEKNEKQEKLIGINLRNWENIANVKYKVIEFIEYFTDKGFKIKLISFQKGNDETILKSILGHIKDEKITLVEIKDEVQAVREISKLEVLIGMRLHGLIFSSIAKVPFIGISYDPKVELFSKEMGQEYLDIKKLMDDNKDLKSVFDKVYFEKTRYTKIISDNLNKMKSYSKGNLDIFEKVKIG